MQQLATELDAKRFTEQQLNLFAASVANPAMLRRRVTDRYEARRRVVERRTFYEFDLAFMPTGTQNSEDLDGVANSWTSVDNQPKYLTVLLSPKGRLHDYARITDGKGRAVSVLSYREYRVLAGLTLRRLLIAAFSDTSIPDNALDLEREYFKLLLQFGITTDKAKGPTTKARVERILNDLDLLRDTVPPSGVLHIDTLKGLVSAFATNYAVVAVLPADTSQRFFLTFESTEIPALRWASGHSLSTWLRMLVGANPVSLRVDADNALTCQSYHLLVSSTEDLYLSDFDAPFMSPAGQEVTPEDSNVLRTDSRVNYFRFRGRRGQHYCHLYSRVVPDIDTDKLRVGLQFFEVPPGSIGRAMISAVAGLLTIFVVAMAHPVDVNIAVFLLALPGIAAVWLGFEGNQPRLLEGTLSSRVSLFTTFLAALAASILLLLQRADGSAGSETFDRLAWPHALWAVVMAVAATNAAIMISLYCERTQYYKKIANRPDTDASVEYVDFD